MFSDCTAFFQKRRCDCIVTYRCKNILPLFGRNSTSFDIYTRFYLSTSPSQTRVRKSIFFATAIFTETFTCSSWKRCTFIYLFWLCCWNNCSYLCVVLPSGLIINLEGLWEGRKWEDRRHYRPLLLISNISEIIEKLIRNRFNFFFVTKQYFLLISVWL